MYCFNVFQLRSIDSLLDLDFSSEKKAHKMNKIPVLTLVSTESGLCE
jgi:hypothetical protein